MVALGSARTARKSCKSIGDCWGCDPKRCDFSLCFSDDAHDFLLSLCPVDIGWLLSAEAIATLLKEFRMFF